MWPLLVKYMALKSDRKFCIEHQKKWYAFEEAEMRNSISIQIYIFSFILLKSFPL